MELFTLLAKLALDTSEYDKAIEKAKGQATDFELEDPSLGLNTNDFDTAVAEAGTTVVEDPPSPSLGLDPTDFDNEVVDANSAVVDGPADPDLGLDHTDFDTALNTASGNAETFSGSVNEMFAGVKTALQAAGITAAVTGIANLIKQAVELTAKTGDAIDKGSKGMGITTRQYQIWDHALRQSGGSVGDLNRGMMSFRKILADTTQISNEEAEALKALNISLIDETTGRQKTRAELAEEAKLRGTVAKTTAEQKAALDVYNSLLGDGTKLTDDQANAFRKLKVGLVGADGAMKTSEQLMNDVLTALAEYDNKANDRDSIIDTLFGKNAASVKALVADGVEPFVDLMNEADDLGMIMTDEEIKNAVGYGDALANLHSELDAIQTAFTKEIMPLLTGAIKDVTKVLAFFNPRIGSNKLSDMFADSDDQLSTDLITIEATATQAENLIEKLFSMGDATKLTAEEQVKWKETADWLVKNIPSLSGVIDVDTMSINGNTKEIKENIRQWKIHEMERAKSEALERKKKALTEKTVALVDAQTRAQQLLNDAETEEIALRLSLKDAYDKLDPEVRKQFLSTYGQHNLNENGELDFTRDSTYGLLQRMFTGGYGGEGGMLAGYATTDLKNRLTKGFNLNAVEQKKKEAEAAAAEAAALQEEVNKGTAELESYETAMDQLFDTTSESLGLTEEELADTKAKAEEYSSTLEGIPSDVSTTVHMDYDTGSQPASHAIGARYIPYDNYPALLHRGEEVLTASQARRNQGGDIDLGAFETAMERAILRGMESANVTTHVSDGEVASGANRVNGRRIESGRFLP